MADTGSPWNIPFAEPTDLVRDWPNLSEDVADAVAAGLTAANVGIGSNVVQTVKTDTFTTTTSGYQAVTGLSVTITPTSLSSKVLLLATINGIASSTANSHVYFRITGGNAGTFVGDAAGDRTRAASGMRMSTGFGTEATGLSFPITFLDAPNTTSPTTYQVEVSRFAGTVAINASTPATDGDVVNQGRLATAIVAIEVAA